MKNNPIYNKKNHTFENYILMKKKERKKVLSGFRSNETDPHHEKIDNIYIVLACRDKGFPFSFPKK